MQRYYCLQKYFYVILTIRFIENVRQDLSGEAYHHVITESKMLRFFWVKYGNVNNLK